MNLIQIGSLVAHAATPDRVATVKNIVGGIAHLVYQHAHPDGTPSVITTATHPVKDLLDRTPKPPSEGEAVPADAAHEDQAASFQAGVIANNTPVAVDPISAPPET